MKKTFILYLTALVFIVSCKKKEERFTIEPVVVKNENDFTKLLSKYSENKSFKNGDCEFVLATNKTADNKLLFYTKGLKPELREVITFNGEVMDIFIADIDNNNIKELYITSTPMKGTTYESVKDVGILGYTLNDNRKVSRIKPEEIDDIKDFNTDNVTLKNNTLSRTYIINNIKTRYNYKLAPEKKGYKLVPHKVE